MVERAESIGLVRDVAHESGRVAVGRFCREYAWRYTA
jgi:hypothetical protein